MHLCDRYHLRPLQLWYQQHMWQIPHTEIHNVNNKNYIPEVFKAGQNYIIKMEQRGFCKLINKKNFEFRIMEIFAADTHLKLLDQVVSGASFLTGGVFECDTAPCQFVAVLCMLYKIRCNPMHPLYCALTGLQVPVQVTQRALFTLWYMHALPHSTAALSFHCKYHLEMILLSWYSIVWDLMVSRAGPMPFIDLALAPILTPTVFSLSSAILWYGIVGHTVFGLMG